MPEATVAGQLIALEKVAWAFAEEIRKRDPQAANAIAAQLEKYEMSCSPNAQGDILKTAEDFRGGHNSVLFSVQKCLEVD